MDIVIRAAVAFVFILVLTRIVGRRELNSLEPFDLILLVTIGDLVQQGVTQNDFSVTGLMLAVGMTLMEKVKDQTLKCEALSLEIRNRTKVPLPTMEEYDSPEPPAE